jgi:hypothetical protein
MHRERESARWRYNAIKKERMDGFLSVKKRNEKKRYAARAGAHFRFMRAMDNEANSSFFLKKKNAREHRLRKKNCYGGGKKGKTTIPHKHTLQ